MSKAVNLKSLIAGCGVGVAMSTFPVAVSANDMSSDQLPLVMAQASVFDQETIDAFAAAQVRIDEIRASYTPQFQAAETDDERQKINEQAVQEMVAAVRQAPNITVEEYDAVVQAANQDAELAERINQAIAEVQS